MSKEKLEKDKRDYKVCVHLTSEESEKVKQTATACGMSISEFLRHVCMGYEIQPKPVKDFWELLKRLYEVHDSFKMCIPFYPTAIETCKEIEKFIINLQQAYTMPRKIDIEKLTRKGEN